MPFALARALLAVSRARSTGILQLRGDRGAARAAIVSGTLRALVIEDRTDTETLGDTLVRSGTLSPGAHARALDDTPRRATPIGEWLVATGATSGEAVSHALRVQLRQRVRHIFGWRDLRYAFHRGPADLGVLHIEEPFDTGELVVAALRDAMGAERLDRARRRLGDPSTRFELASLGESLLRAATLWPDEAALIGVLRRGVPLGEALVLASATPRAIRMAAALHGLDVLRASVPGRAACALLVRKRGEIRASATPLALLELPAGATPAQARRALRRFARALHPDRLGPDAPQALRLATTEVLGALTRAASEVGSAT